MSTRNSTQYAILGLLAVRPMSGYELSRNFRQSLNFFWAESNGQLYPNLKRLAAGGFILPLPARAAGKRVPQQYALAPAGRQRLRAWLAELPRPQPPRNELLLKLFLGRSAPPGVIAGHIAAFKREYEHALATLTSIATAAGNKRREPGRAGRAQQPAPGASHWLLCLDFGMRLRGVQIAWCDAALKKLTARRAGSAAGECRADALAHREARYSRQSGAALARLRPDPGSDRPHARAPGGLGATLDLGLDRTRAQTPGWRRSGDRPQRHRVFADGVAGRSIAAAIGGPPEPGAGHRRAYPAGLGRPRAAVDLPPDPRRHGARVSSGSRPDRTHPRHPGFPPHYGDHDPGVGNCPAFNLPVQRYLILRPVLGYGCLAGLVLWSFWYGKRRRRRATDSAEAQGE